MAPKELPTRILSLVVVTSVALLWVLAPPAVAAPPPCRVTNLTTGQVYDGTGSNLQTAIDQASVGTRLRIRGVCVGTYLIDKSLSLIGWQTAAFPTPTLDGDDAGTVLTVNQGSVVVQDLTITHGNAGYGGGIYNEGTVDLRGHTAVRANDASGGGGIYNAGALSLHGTSSLSQNEAMFQGGGLFNFGTVDLYDSSAVSENVAVTDFSEGGGIENYGSAILHDSASVWGNQAGDSGGGETFAGGGILNGGTLVLKNTSSVMRNTTTLNGDGGGIVNGGSVTMNGSSSVRRNTATGADGGGIFNAAGTVTMNGQSSVRRNTAINGTGGGIFKRSGTLIGAVAGGNVSDNVPNDIAP